MGSTAYQQAVGKRLRALRAQRGWSLTDAEDACDGRWAAVVLGSYERGDRALSVQKLSDLARFYGVRPADLLPDEDAPPADSRVARLAEALHEAGIGPGEYASDIARRLVFAGVVAPKARKAGAA